VHRTNARFWRCFNQLPQPIQILAKKNFELLKNNLNHPSLSFKKVGKFWSVRVGINYRALAFKDGEDSNALKLININLTKTQSLSIQALQARIVDSFT